MSKYDALSNNRADEAGPIDFVTDLPMFAWPLCASEFVALTHALGCDLQWARQQEDIPQEIFGGSSTVHEQYQERAERMGLALAGITSVIHLTDDLMVFMMYLTGEGVKRMRDEAPFMADIVAELRDAMREPYLAWRREIGLPPFSVEAAA